MTAWQKFGAGHLVPSSVSSSIASVVTLVEEYIELARRALEIAKGVGLPGGGVDPLAAAAQGLLDVVEGLLHAGKVHALFVPVGKVLPTPPGATAPPTIEDLQASLDVDLTGSGVDLAKAGPAYLRTVGQAGGNKGFYNQFLQSLMDPLDQDRPQYFGQFDAVAMLVVLAGAPSLALGLEAAAGLNRIFRPPTNGDLTARVIPAPQNVFARVVGVPTSTHIGVRVSWDPPKDVLPIYFPGVSLSVNRYALIRSTSARALSATSVLDLFTTRDLTEGLVLEDGADTHKVIAVGSGSNSSYLDDDDSLDPTAPYYYAVAWEVKILENGNETTIPFDRLSNVAKVVPRAPSRATHGVPPDWAAYGSAVDLFPDIAASIELGIDRLRAFTTKTQGAAGQVNKTFALADNSLTRLENDVAALGVQFERLAAMLSQPTPGLFVTTMSSGRGGNAYLIAELAKRLNDVSDPTRPPFDDNEYVTGVCIVAGASNLGELQPIIDFFSTFFGASSPSNSLLSVLTSLDAIVTQAEATVFGQNLQPLPPGTVVDPLTGLPPSPPSPVIADSGTPVGTNDPQNPNIGDTNVTPLKDLC